MATSEIEIVSESNKQNVDTTTTAQSPNQIPIIDVYSASAYGDFDQLRKFVEKDGASVSVPDGNDYFALQWAALNNFSDILQYLIHRNKRDFFVFLWLGTLTALDGGVVAVQRIWTSVPLPQGEESWIHRVIFEHPAAFAFISMDAIILAARATLLTVQASQIARNITTNEMANAIRYGYLRGADGHFRNPYNHGCRKNCSDFLIDGYTNDEEIAWPPLQQVAS